jgi:hypothetical protein
MATATQPDPSLAPQDSPGEIVALSAGISTGVQFIADGRVSEGVTVIITGALPFLMKLLVKYTS